MNLGHAEGGKKKFSPHLSEGLSAVMCATGQLWGIILFPRTEVSEQICPQSGE